MFTGLKAVNHFGRPDMSSFLKFVQKKHSYVSNLKSNERCAATELNFFTNFLGFKNWRLLVWSPTAYQKCHVSVWRSEQRPQASVLHSSFREFRLKAVDFVVFRKKKNFVIFLVNWSLRCQESGRERERVCECDQCFNLICKMFSFK